VGYTSTGWQHEFTDGFQNYAKAELTRHERRRGGESKWFAQWGKARAHWSKGSALHMHINRDREWAV
jgi:hypothetical protein